jgi:mRNA interferase HigB
MWIITEKPLQEFTARHPQAAQSLAIWTKMAKAGRFADGHELRATFPSASFLDDGRVVFNLGGNNYRLVATLKYVTPAHRLGRIYVRRVLTHAEYTRLTKAGRL